MEIQLSEANYQNLEDFEKILQKTPSQMINEALDLYFEQQHKLLLEKNLENENAMTNLDYDEFWDGVDL